MPHYFFSETESAQEAITGLYDFVWPTAAGMWNLRWQVRGYLDAVPNATKAQLESRFIEGADIRGANLRRSCMEHTWERQKSAFAHIVLTNAIAIYEGWAEAVVDDLSAPAGYEKKLQFPGPNGVSMVVTQLTTTESAVLRDNLYATYTAGQKYAWAHMEAMLRCYRFFKEMRNCLMHGGGLADQRLAIAYAAFEPYATTAALGVAEVPRHVRPIENEPVMLNLRGVVGFSHVILKIMASIDAELCRAQAAEPVFAARWRAVHSRRRDLPSSETRRLERIRRMIRHAGFPRPTNLEAFSAWLTAQGLLSF